MAFAGGLWLVVWGGGCQLVVLEGITGDVGGYHYYPRRDQVTGWLQAAGLQTLDEGFNQEDGWGYRHFLLRSPGHNA